MIMWVVLYAYDLVGKDTPLHNCWVTVLYSVIVCDMHIWECICVQSMQSEYLQRLSLAPIPEPFK